MTSDEQSIIDEMDAQFAKEGSMAAVAAQPFALSFERGLYAFECTNAYLGRSATSNRKQLVAVTKVREAPSEEFIGQNYTKTWGLETPENLAWLKRDMIALGLDEPQSPKDVLEIAHALCAGMCFQGQLVPQKDSDYPANLFLNKGARREDLESATTEKGGDTPF